MVDNTDRMYTGCGSKLAAGDVTAFHVSAELTAARLQWGGRSSRGRRVAGAAFGGGTCSWRHTGPDGCGVRGLG